MTVKTGSRYISGTMTNSIEIPTTNSGFSMMTSSIKVQPNDFDNERLPEIASSGPKRLQGGPKNLAPFSLYASTLPNIKRFSKLFHCQNQEKICNNTVAKDPTTPQVCRYTTVLNISDMKQQLKTIRRLLQQHILINYQQETTCLLSQLLSKVTHILQILHQGGPKTWHNYRATLCVARSL